MTWDVSDFYVSELDAGSASSAALDRATAS
jgi:hypothetical protein